MIKVVLVWSALAGAGCFVLHTPAAQVLWAAGCSIAAAVSVFSVWRDSK